MYSHYGKGLVECTLIMGRDWLNVLHGEGLVGCTLTMVRDWLNVLSLQYGSMGRGSI